MEMTGGPGSFSALMKRSGGEWPGRTRFPSGCRERPSQAQDAHVHAEGSSGSAPGRA